MTIITLSVIFLISLFFLTMARSSLLAWIGWSVFILTSQRILCLIFQDNFLSVHIQFVSFGSIPFPIVSAFAFLLCQFPALTYLGDFFIYRATQLKVVAIFLGLWILAFTWLVFMVLFLAAINNHSVSLSIIISRCFYEQFFYIVFRNFHIIVFIPIFVFWIL